MKCTLIFSLIFENSKNQSFLLRSSRNETNLYTNTTLAYRSTFLERTKESLRNEISEYIEGTLTIASFFLFLCSLDFLLENFGQKFFPFIVLSQIGFEFLEQIFLLFFQLLNFLFLHFHFSIAFSDLK